MAIVPQYLQKDEDKEMETLSPQAPAASSAPTTGPSAAPASGGMSGPTQTQNNVKKSGPGMFNNIRQYVSANAPRTERMGQAVGKQFDNQAAQIGQTVQQKQQAQEQKVANVQGTLQQQKQTASSIFDQANQGQTIDPNTVQQFRQATTPETVDPYGFNTATSRDQYQVKALKDLAQKTKNEEGRFDLLQRTFGNQGYTSGQSRLDQLLLQRSPNAAQNLVNQAQNATQQAQGTLDTSRQAVLQQIAGLKPMQDEIRGINTRVGTTQEEMRADLAARAKQREDYIAALARDTRLEQGINGENKGFVNLDPKALEYLGIQAPELYGQAQLFGLDPSQFLSKSESAAATQQDLARAKALAALAGKEQDIIADPNMIGGGIDRLQSALTQAQSDYQKALKDSGTQDKYDSLVKMADVQKLQEFGNQLKEQFNNAKFIRRNSYGDSATHGGGMLEGINLNQINQIATPEQARELNSLSSLINSGYTDKQQRFYELGNEIIDGYTKNVGSQADALRYMQQVGQPLEHLDAGPFVNDESTQWLPFKIQQQIKGARDALKQQEKIRQQFALRGWSPDDIQKALLGIPPAGKANL